MSRRQHQRRKGDGLISIIIRWMSDGADDVAYALRGMRRRPGFAAAVVLTLALGIAASTSVFSVISAVLLKPLPYPEADRLVLFAHAWRGRTLVNVSLPRIAAWRAHTDAVEEVAIYRLGGSMDFSSARPGGTGSGDDSTQVIAGRATSGFFRLLGAAVLHGRVFTADEDHPHGPRVAVLSHGFWRRRFDAAPDVVGRTISLEGLSHLVVGVLSPTFDARSADPFAQPVPDLWVPLQPDLNDQSDANNLLVAARLKPGVGLAAAQAQAKAGTEAFRKEWPQNMPANLSLTVIPLAEAVVEDTRPSLLLLAAAVAFVLLIVIANTTCLMLVRASDRQRELAIRVAAGASRGRLVRQLLTESLVLSMSGGVLGVLLGLTGIRALLAWQPATIARVTSAASGASGGLSGSGGVDLLGSAGVFMDWRLLSFAVAVTLISGVAVGMLPALRASRMDVEEHLRSGGERGGASRHHERTRTLLAVSEVALACLLLVGTGLLMRSFVEMRRVSPGFETARVLSMTTLVTASRYAAMSTTTRMMDDAIRTVGAVPGVEAAGATLTGLPLEGEKSAFRIGLAAKPEQNLMGAWHVISADYLPALNIPLVRGRGFTNQDDRGAPPVVIINQALARTFWPGGNPLGDLLILGQGAGPDFADVPRRIVGIVGDIHQWALNRPPKPTAYVPLAQLPDNEMSFMNRHGGTLTWVVRTSGSPHAMTAAVSEALRTATGAPVGRIQSMEDVSSQSTASTRFQLSLMTLFGGAALLLAALGVYGVTSYSVQRRTREIGVRQALGATPAAIRRTVLGRGLSFTFAGIALGVAGAFGLARLLSTFLFGITPHDTLVFVLAPCALSVVALTAVWLPARRATRVDLVTALRAE
jgi:putative ABC transport system permease protein